LLANILREHYDALPQIMLLAQMFEWINSPEAWVSLATLFGLEIVLGIDNIIFISILVAKLPENQRNRARRLGLLFAMASRLMLLVGLAWVVGLVETLFVVFGEEISGRDVILLSGGLFLLAKSTHEIHASFEEKSLLDKHPSAVSLPAVLIQIAILDVVFSLDSVITAVGLVDHLAIMVIAIIASVLVMLIAAKPIGDFVDANPTLKMLALSFLILVGFTLIAEGFDAHVPKGYIYFAMFFSFAVEMLNIRIKAQKQRSSS
jgi:predicted tellurium resistance membrane protein TerC